MFDLPGMTGVSEVVNEEAVSGNAEPLMIYQDLKEKACLIFIFMFFKIANLFIWWNGQTIGTFLYTKFWCICWWR